jgi:hypothetical protein
VTSSHSSASPCLQAVGDTVRLVSESVPLKPTSLAKQHKTHKSPEESPTEPRSKQGTHKQGDRPILCQPQPNPTLQAACLHARRKDSRRTQSSPNPAVLLFVVHQLVAGPKSSGTTPRQQWSNKFPLFTHKRPLPCAALTSDLRRTWPLDATERVYSMTCVSLAKSTRSVPPIWCIQASSLSQSVSQTILAL